MSITPEQYTAAYELGVAAAKAAASWATAYDLGGVAADHYARLVRMMDEGDPALDDHLPQRPNLSGEWADAPTDRSIAADVLGADYATHGYNAPDLIAAELVDAVASAWEEGVDDTFDAECERLIRAAAAE
jgi:hypothetical protein